MKPPFQKVTIKWLDAKSNAGWENVEDVIEERPAVISTTGYLLFENEECIILGLTLGEEEDVWQVNGWFCIPTPWIVERQVGTGKARKKRAKQEAQQTATASTEAKA